MTSCCRTRFSSESDTDHPRYSKILIAFRARRNAQGHLEPDAPDDVVQASQGWSDITFAEQPRTGA